MKIHNDGYDFRRDAPLGDQKAFRSPPVRVSLEAGERLFRLVTALKNNLLASPWWFRRDTFQAMAHMSKVQNCSIPEVARAKLAVTTEMNERLDHLCIIEVIQPVYAWEGPARHQSEPRDGGTVELMGGLRQLYLPHLVSDRGAGRGGFDSSPIVKYQYHGPIVP